MTEREQSGELEALEVQVMVFRLKLTVEGSEDRRGQGENRRG